VGAYARGLLKGLIRAGFDSNLTLLGQSFIPGALTHATATPVTYLLTPSYRVSPDLMVSRSSSATFATAAESTGGSGFEITPRAP